MIEKKRKIRRKKRIISKRYLFFYTLKKIKLFVNHYIKINRKNKKKVKKE